MFDSQQSCPDCDDTPQSDTPQGVNRRNFLKTAGVAATLGAGAAAMGVGAAPLWAAPRKSTKKTGKPESVVKVLYDSMTEAQKKAVCFDWDHTDGSRGLLRTRVANNWQITKNFTSSDFYTDDQRQMVREIFEGIIQPDWHARFDKQLKDDAGGFGKQQSIAIFGEPGEGDFEFVLTGRHMTLRCDGNSADHVALGGPIFYGHAAQGFNEKPDHPGNVFWHQALAANKVYQALDGKQRKISLEPKAPREQNSGFRGKKGDFDGIAIAELSSDQKELVQKTLGTLIEPYRKSDQDEVLGCLKTQGGLDQCHMAFYESGNLGDDEVWDVWRLEGPSFVWHYRGSPHVHVWVNVADDASVKLNA